MGPTQKEKVVLGPHSVLRMDTFVINTENAEVKQKSTFFHRQGHLSSNLDDPQAYLLQRGNNWLQGNFHSHYIHDMRADVIASAQSQYWWGVGSFFWARHHRSWCLFAEVLILTCNTALLPVVTLATHLETFISIYSNTKAFLVVRHLSSRNLTILFQQFNFAYWSALWLIALTMWWFKLRLRIILLTLSLRLLLPPSLQNVAETACEACNWVCPPTALRQRQCSERLHCVRHNGYVHIHITPFSHSQSHHIKIKLQQCSVCCWGFCYLTLLLELNLSVTFTLIVSWKNVHTYMLQTTNKLFY